MTAATQVPTAISDALVVAADSVLTFYILLCYLATCPAVLPHNEDFEN